MVKKYLPWMLCAAVVLLLIHVLGAANDDAIAALMEARIMRTINARDAAIIAKYVHGQAALDKELAAVRRDASDAHAVAAVFRAKSEAAQVKVKTLEGCTVLLDEAQAFALKQADDFAKSFGRLNATWEMKFKLKEQEMAERVAQLKKSAAELAHDMVMWRLRAQRRWALGPQCGYGTNGAYVGVGVTYSIKRW